MPPSLIIGTVVILLALAAVIVLARLVLVVRADATLGDLNK